MKYLQLSNGMKAVVDDEDYEFLSTIKWHYSAGYATCYRKGAGNVKNKTVPLHIVIMGDSSENLQVDHINGDKLDCRRSNLRFATIAQNARNRPPKKTKTSSQYKGVHWSNDRKYWYSMIGPRNSIKWLGRFDSEIDAAMAYDRAATVLYGEFARLNFPEGLQ